MPLLLWLSRLVSSTITFAVHLVVSGGLFIVSALLLTLPDPDASVVGSVVRGIAAIWLWAATWHYLLRGVLQRPAAPRDAQRSKPTGAQAAIGTLGCLASLGAVVVVYLAVGPWADWVVAGFTGEDPTHPARVLFDRGLVELEAAAQQPERFVGYFVAAVFGATPDDDLNRLLRRADAVRAFLDTEDGANLLTAHRRAANILRIEEKRDGHAYDTGYEPHLLKASEEQALADALETAARRVELDLDAEDFERAMDAMAALRAPVDAFFDRVTVNDPAPELRRNRLRLLARLRAAMDAVADFSKIEG